MEHSPSVSPGTGIFARRFRARAGSDGSVLSFADFMDLALYDPEIGYYRTNRTRVGRAAGADFYTSANMSEAFGPLVATAATTLLRRAPARDFEFVEIGAEPGRSVLDGVDHGFHGVRSVRIGEPLELRGVLVVFSNELFDAQPFHRVVFRGGLWCEMGVQLVAGQPAWAELPAFSPALARVAHHLPPTAPAGYVLDVPLAAEQLIRAITDQPWQGLFLTLDYGRKWSQLVRDHPSGTGRAYSSQRQSGDLLEHPGERDLTCHVCWDWLEVALREGGFGAVTRESQEAFFVHHASTEMHRIVATDRNPLSPRRTQLRHLLHPALMGQRFEALWGLRK